MPPADLQAQAARCPTVPRPLLVDLDQRHAVLAMPLVGRLFLCLSYGLLCVFYVLLSLLLSFLCPLFSVREAAPRPLLVDLDPRRVVLAMPLVG